MIQNTKTTKTYTNGVIFTPSEQTWMHTSSLSLLPLPLFRFSVWSVKPPKKVIVFEQRWLLFPEVYLRGLSLCRKGPLKCYIRPLNWGTWYIENQLLDCLISSQIVNYIIIQRNIESSTYLHSYSAVSRVKQYVLKQISAIWMHCCEM